MSKKINWGILGTGGICNNFAVSLVKNESAIAAIGASSLEKAESFREKFKANKAYGSYAELVEDPEVDVVYVGTVNTMHLPHAKLALEAGKHVLCEKPMGVNEAQARELVELARSKNLFLMEGYWTRFFPAVRKAAEVFTSGAIGAPTYVQADFGFKGPDDPGHRLWDPTMAGGALLDIGCYMVQVGTWVFGNTLPEHIAVTGRKAPSGVDVDGSMALTWEGKGSGSFLYTLTANTPEVTTVMCERGKVTLHNPGHTPTKITIGREVSRGVYDEEVLEFALPDAPEGVSAKRPIYLGLLYEVQTVEECLSKGLTECPELPLDESLVIAKVLETCRQQLGVKFPCDAL